MDILTYIQQFTSPNLKARKLSLEEHIYRLEADLADAKRDYSDVSAALVLKSRSLQPGDIIETSKDNRCRIESDSKYSIPVGQPVNIDGSLIGGAILLYPVILAHCKKVAP